MKFKPKGTVITAFQMLEMSQMQHWMQLSHHLHFTTSWRNIKELENRQKTKNNKDTYNGKLRGQNRSLIYLINLINFKNPWFSVFWSQRKYAEEYLKGIRTSPRTSNKAIKAKEGPDNAEGIPLNFLCGMLMKDYIEDPRIKQILN